MGTYLITGGAGFFGSILKEELLNKGHTCVSIDLEPDDYCNKVSGLRMTDGAIISGNRLV
ncbi:nucleoside-diphosphate-sugar epimerase [Brachyspira sp. CAG:484]|nr:nucleoside-diphosphate-sugar epimerase [Brachyspira sp. CAG:484]